ncbi:uncharacterized protein LY89DRAFT_268472 [Mollisia scopiformis]|uniref:Uncharacterized protein n=1 Tax=Mollisia scopiformis TaxID=149040 RepID=A0A132BC89_MOLSC|nr:uncharacterized protein LY89DRAFT_268472 [Mollisia scopiformis]KUJ10042.1 hypothetical protein LY89DRAFT_268472 [Mollisia scopiformis]
MEQICLVMNAFKVILERLHIEFPDQTKMSLHRMRHPRKAIISFPSENNFRSIFLYSLFWMIKTNTRVGLFVLFITTRYIYCP